MSQGFSPSTPDETADFLRALGKSPKAPKTKLIATGALLVGFLFGLVITMPGRYTVINAEEPIKVDKWTGKTWVKTKYSKDWQEMK